MQGEDALWSIVQMPKGVPVATVAIGNGWNAGVLATQILSTGDSKLALTLRKTLNDYKIEMEKLVEQMNKKLTTI
jgi:phosphoribosylaminoimidazole carboxylase PurE protein